MVHRWTHAYPIHSVLEENCRKANKTRRFVKPLEIGEKVRIRQGKRWLPAIVQQIVNNRSYGVKTENEGFNRRNRQHLLKAKKAQFSLLVNLMSQTNHPLTEIQAAAYHTLLKKSPVTQEMLKNPKSQKLKVLTLKYHRVRSPSRNRLLIINHRNQMIGYITQRDQVESSKCLKSWICKNALLFVQIEYYS